MAVYEPTDELADCTLPRREGERDPAGRNLCETFCP
jgi:hypothetical protein